MPLFDTDNRLRSDVCARHAQDAQNLTFAGYVFRDSDRNSKPSHPQGLTTEELSELSTRTRSRDGWGIMPDAVNVDSAFRTPNGGYTHDRTRQGLSTRVFGAAPDLGRGGLDAAVESRLQSQLSGNGTERECSYRFAEVDYDRFDPGVRPVAVTNIVIPFPAGEPSRDIARSSAFLSEMGYGRCADRAN